MASHTLYWQPPSFIAVAGLGLRDSTTNSSVDQIGMSEFWRSFCSRLLFPLDTSDKLELYRKLDSITSRSGVVELTRREHGQVVALVSKALETMSHTHRIAFFPFLESLLQASETPPDAAQ
jgi:hypothetical protein